MRGKRYLILLQVICSLVLIGILLVGLWPLNFFPENEVEWLKERNGIHIYGNGIVYSSGLFRGEKGSNFRIKEITIEIWLQSEIEPVEYLARIFSLIDSDRKEILTFAQWQSTLYIVRGPITDGRLRDESKRIVNRKKLRIGTERFITVTSNEGGTAVYLDGKLEKFDSNFTFIEDKKEISERLIFGNSPTTGSKQWVGNVYGLAIYHRSLGKEEVHKHYQSWLDHGFPTGAKMEDTASLFLFDEREGALIRNRGFLSYNLLIPENYKIINKALLERPKKIFQNMSRKAQMDVMINILGFIPAGFIICAYLSCLIRLRWFTAVSLTLFLCAGMSLLIELLQFYLPIRESSLLDLFNNSLGAAVGVAAFYIVAGIGKSTLFLKKSAGPERSEK